MVYPLDVCSFPRSTYGERGLEKPARMVFQACGSAKASQEHHIAAAIRIQTSRSVLGLGPTPQIIACSLVQIVGSTTLLGAGQQLHEFKVSLYCLSIAENIFSSVNRFLTNILPLLPILSASDGSRSKVRMQLTSSSKFPRE